MLTLKGMLLVVLTYIVVGSQAHQHQWRHQLCKGVQGAYWLRSKVVLPENQFYTRMHALPSQQQLHQFPVEMLQNHTSLNIGSPPQFFDEGFPQYFNGQEFIAEYGGYLNVSEEGIYEFVLTASDGAVLYISQEAESATSAMIPVVNWRPLGLSEFGKGKAATQMKLSEGLHRFVMRFKKFSQSSGQPGVQLMWSKLTGQNQFAEKVVGLDDLWTECSMQASPGHLLSDLSIFQIDRESLLFKDVATDIEDLDMLEDIPDKIKNSIEAKLDYTQTSPKSKTQDFPVYNWYAFEDFESYRAPVAQSIPHAVPSPKITSLQQFPAPKGPPPPTPSSLTRTPTPTPSLSSQAGPTSTPYPNYVYSSQNPHMSHTANSLSGANTLSFPPIYGEHLMNFVRVAPQVQSIYSEDFVHDLHDLFESFLSYLVTSVEDTSTLQHLYDIHIEAFRKNETEEFQRISQALNIFMHQGFLEGLRVFEIERVLKLHGINVADVTISDVVRKLHDVAHEIIKHDECTKQEERYAEAVFDTFQTLLVYATFRSHVQNESKLDSIGKLIQGALSLHEIKEQYQIPEMTEMHEMLYNAHDAYGNDDTYGTHDLQGAQGMQGSYDPYGDYGTNNDQDFNVLLNVNNVYRYADEVYNMYDVDVVQNGQHGGQYVYDSLSSFLVNGLDMLNVDAENVQSADVYMNDMSRMLATISSLQGIAHPEIKQEEQQSIDMKQVKGDQNITQDNDVKFKEETYRYPESTHLIEGVWDETTNDQGEQQNITGTAQYEDRQSFGVYGATHAYYGGILPEQGGQYSIGYGAIPVYGANYQGTFANYGGYNPTLYGDTPLYEMQNEQEKVSNYGGLELISQYGNYQSLPQYGSQILAPQYGYYKWVSKYGGYQPIATYGSDFYSSLFITNVMNQLSLPKYGVYSSSMDSPVYGSSESNFLDRLISRLQTVVNPVYGGYGNYGNY